MTFLISIWYEPIGFGKLLFSLSLKELFCCKIEKKKRTSEHAYRTRWSHIHIMHNIYIFTWNVSMCQQCVTAESYPDTNGYCRDRPATTWCRCCCLEFGRIGSLVYSMTCVFRHIIKFIQTNIRTKEVSLACYLSSAALCWWLIVASWLIPVSLIISIYYGNVLYILYTQCLSWGKRWSQLYMYV